MASLLLGRAKSATVTARDPVRRMSTCFSSTLPIPTVWQPYREAFRVRDDTVQQTAHFSCELVAKPSPLLIPARSVA
jgi:hypothetical protein